MDNLSKFASFRRVYHFSTFNDLLDFIKPISNKDRPHQVHLTPINVENIRTSFKKDLTIEFAVVNAGFQPLPKLDIRFSPPKGIGALKYFNDANVYVHSSSNLVERNMLLLPSHRVEIILHQFLMLFLLKFWI